MTDKLIAYHIDLKRPMWTRPYLEQMVARLKGWGFNAILVEIEDKFRFDRHPAIAHPDAWSPAEWAGCARFCRDQGIEVIPMIQALGHAECVVGKPEYARLRVNPQVTDEYNPVSADARALIVELCGEIIEAMQPARFFHLGGDETRSLTANPEAQALADRFGVGGVYLQHMIPLFDQVRRRGLRPMIWADIVLAHPEILKDVPRDVVLVDWDYQRVAERGDRVRVWSQIGTGNSELRRADLEALPESAAKRFTLEHAVDDQTGRDGTLRVFYHTEALAKMGFDVVTASASRCGGDTVAAPMTMHLENVFASMRAGAAHGLGSIVTSWAIRRNHPELGLPAAFVAPGTIHPDRLDRAVLIDRYTRTEFGAPMPALEVAWGQVAELVYLCESKTIGIARRMFDRGEDPVEMLRRDVREGTNATKFHRPVSKDQDPDRVAAAGRLIESRRAGYRAARRTLEELQRQARQNAETFEFWLEAADLAGFYADFSLALLEGALAKRAGDLLGRLNALRDRTRMLWERTYATGSIADELRARYGFHEDYLKRKTN